MYVTIRGMPSGDVVPLALSFPCYECGAKPKRDCPQPSVISPKSRYHGKRVRPWRFNAAMTNLRLTASSAVESELEKWRT